jgi:uncharacterized protein (TIGR00255 family)
MTGFGRGEAASGGMKVEVELSSVNRKQFDLHFNLPKALAAQEARVYEIIHQTVSRGAITGSTRVSVSGKALQKYVSVDADMAAAYMSQLSKTARRLGLKNDLTARTLVQLPEVVRFEAPEKDSSCVWPLMQKAIASALQGLSEMKRKEGKAIEKDVLRRLTSLQAFLRRIKKMAPTVANNYRRSLERRLCDGGFDVSKMDSQMLKEVALFAERADISEEIVRLESHFNQGFGLIRSHGPSGRSLDFLCQEMLREINTIGSKANNTAITECVIQFKATLESVREQVQNVE